MSNKDKCKDMMEKMFGPASSILVDEMAEEDCIERCRAKVKAFLGEEKAKEFDGLEVKN